VVTAFLLSHRSPVNARCSGDLFNFFSADNFCWWFDAITTFVRKANLILIHFCSSQAMATSQPHPNRRRIQKLAGNATTEYVGDHPERIQNNSDNIIEEPNLMVTAVNADGQFCLPLITRHLSLHFCEPLARTAAGTTYFYEADGLGSITSLSSSTGTLPQKYVYDTYGNLTSSTGSVTNPFQFTARENDSETGLYYYRARYYDPSVGRFLSEDRIRFDAGINFYPYVDNNPTDLTDPNGLRGKCPLFGPCYKIGPTRWRPPECPLKTPHFMPLPPGANVNYCGPGARGGDPTGAVDAACMRHDQCYLDHNGLTFLDHWSESPSRKKDVETCDQALCNELDNASHTQVFDPNQGYANAGVRLTFGCRQH